MRYAICLATFAVLTALAPAQSKVSLSKDVLAPTGTLRASFLGGNPVQGFFDAKTGNATGLVPDLVKELARRLGVPYVIAAPQGAGGVIDDLKNNRADIGFLAYEEGRAREVDFGAPFALMHNSFLVRRDSSFQKSSDVDRPGVKVAGVRGQSQQIWASNNLKNAQVKIWETMPPLPEIEKMFLSGEVDVLAVNRQRALDAEARSTSLRALPDNFLELEQCFVVAKGDQAKLKQLEAFAADVLSSGFVRVSLDRAKVTGADPAPVRKN